jgi:hypothetical protein
MEKDKIFEKMNPERREFIKTAAKAAFVIPAVVSVSMVDQRLNLATANALTSNATVP